MFMGGVAAKFLGRIINFIKKLGGLTTLNFLRIKLFKLLNCLVQSILIVEDFDVCTENRVLCF